MVVKRVYETYAEWRNEKYELHRLDGPAVIFEYKKEWWQSGKRHRLGAPAVEWHNGNKEWYINGKRHRLDGPAIEYIGTKNFSSSEKWCYEDKFIDCNSQEEFERLIKLKAFW